MAAEIFSIARFSKDDIHYNGGYHHKSKNQELTIIKNGVKVTLDEKEIKRLVKIVGANWKW